MKKGNFKIKFSLSTHMFSQILVCLIIAMVIATIGFGCTFIQDTSSELGDTNESNAVAEEGTTVKDTEDKPKGSTEKETTTEEETDQEEVNKEEQEETSPEGISIKVYYTDQQGQNLIGESRTVSSENRYVDALNELIKLPQNNSLINVVPNTTVINKVTVSDGLAEVDLSQSFVDDRFISESVDILLIFSIVNTLTEFDEVNSVSFYIDGNKLNTLGQLDIQDPQFRRSDLISK